MSKEEIRKANYKAFINNDVITVDNVQHFGECIAIKAMKVSMRYGKEQLAKLYAGLIHDVFDAKPLDEPY